MTTKKTKFRYSGKTYIAPQWVIDFAPFAIIAAVAGLAAAWILAVMVIIYI